ncbi:MAG: uracil-DNA glycosylase family protein [Candidatus Cybelea sp.]
MTSVRQAFDSIAHCPNVDRCLGGDTDHPCSIIVLSQHAGKANFQLPEPWRGQIDKARILFVGSNPSIGSDRYALGSSSESQIWESQHLAFGGGSRPYIIDGIRKTKADGSLGEVVRYWSSIRARARELLPDAVPGEDYAITEVVHCKSEHEVGVRQAMRTCYDMHMQSVFAASPAEIVVVLGKVARDALLGASAELPQVPVEMQLGDKRRSVFFLPHPNERGDEKSLVAHYGGQTLERAQNLIERR